jgi:hypothetical protein
MAALLKAVAMVHHTVEAAELSKDAQTDHSGLTKQLLTATTTTTTAATITLQCHITLVYPHAHTLQAHKKLHLTA